MIELFLNDLLVNCNCENNTQYAKNKRREWKILRMALKTKSVTPISDRPFFLLLTVQRYLKKLNFANNSEKFPEGFLWEVNIDEKRGKKE
jgi:hypothetical protein